MLLEEELALGDLTETISAPGLPWQELVSPSRTWRHAEEMVEEDLGLGLPLLTGRKISEYKLAKFAATYFRARPAHLHRDHLSSTACHDGGG